MNYYFISSDQQRFSPFQEAVSALGDGYIVDEVAQLSEALPNEDDAAVFFIHLIGSHDVEEFVQQIRILSSKAIIVHVHEGFKAADIKAHQSGSAGGDAYVSVQAKVEEVANVLSRFGITQAEAPPPLEKKSLDKEFADLNTLHLLSDHFLSREMDAIFKHLVKDTKKKKAETPVPATPEVVMSKNNDESGLSLISDFGELSLAEEGEQEANPPALDEGMDLMLSDDDGADLSLTDEVPEVDENVDGSELNLADAGELDDLSADLNLDDAPGLPEEVEDTGLKLSDNIPSGEGIELDADAGAIDSDSPLDFSNTSLGGDDDLSEDAKEKLREIDEIMENTSSQIIVAPDLDDEEDILQVAPVAKKAPTPSNLDESLVADDLNLDSLDFSAEPDNDEEEEEKPKKKKKEEKPQREAKTESAPAREEVSMRGFGAELKEISGAYTVEMERAQASIANLRADREELLKKIQSMEEDKMMHGRQSLTLRAELDEKKIELSIIRKKLNEEISELKDRLKFHDERRLIMEEKNRILTQELDKAGQKNKIDLKKVQMRERELEQKLELLKSDAETQIRHRDLKILELKRKIDSMEFDMESISIQEKKSVESRFELEDKLDKAIKTLRNAITVLEDESDRENAVQALKKNIDV